MAGYLTFTYSFDTGNGWRRRGCTTDPERRKAEHLRDFPNMSDWRVWDHEHKREMLDYERNLHGLEALPDDAVNE